MVEPNPVKLLAIRAASCSRRPHLIARSLKSHILHWWLVYVICGIQFSPISFVPTWIVGLGGLEEQVLGNVYKGGGTSGRLSSTAVSGSIQGSKIRRE